jgi:AraC family transcriptional activator of pobA
VPGDAGALPIWTLTGTPRVRIVRFAPGQLPGPHVHRYLELLLVEEGEGWHAVDARRAWAQPYNVFLIGTGQVHDLNGMQGCTVWSVDFGADALEPGRSDADVFLALPDDVLLISFLRPYRREAEPIHVAPRAQPHWLTRLALLEEELREKPLGFVEAARALLRLLLIDIARLAAPQLGTHTYQARPLLSHVFRFIEAHHAEPIDLTSVAREVGRAPAYLTDLVRRETGRTVHGWIVERRMAHARSLLLETSQAIGQVAELVGYADASHFIAQFRRLHGTTPRAWRQARY